VWRGPTTVARGLAVAIALALAIALACAVAWRATALGAGATVPGKATESVTLRPTNLKPPRISGKAQLGQILTASSGTWSHSPTSFAYKWKRCDSGGASCRAILQATARSYTLGQSDVGKTLRISVVASNSAGRSAPATSAQTAVVTGSTGEPPVDQALPTISGAAMVGQQLSALPGTWSNRPTSYAYKWKRCSAAGSNCVAIAGAGSATYLIAAADRGSTLRVSVIASNASGKSQPATSAQTAVVTESTAVQHLEYIFTDGLISVYDSDHEEKLIKTISLPQTSEGIRGVTVAPSTHLLFISYGGDGGVFGNGSVLAYDLVSEKVLWTVHLSTGIDSGQVSPDGKRLYMPTGENDPSGVWNILNTGNGAVIGTIQGGASAHNTVASNDGRYVYLGGRDHNYLDVYETAAGKVREVGPLVAGVRPFTVNGSNTLAFTTATEFDGFQVSSITTGKVLFTVSFGAVPKGFAYTAPSHGASLSPDEKQLYVIDSVHKEVQVYDVSRVAEGIAPTQIGVIGVAGLTGNESSCAYDCGRSGWLQHSLDGRFVYVGDSGEVIETATRKVLTTIPTLLNTKKTLEIDWEGGVPVATSGRTGVGYVG
jgi:WD40 repeat protein